MQTSLSEPNHPGPVFWPVSSDAFFFPASGSSTQYAIQVRCCRARGSLRMISGEILRDVISTEGHFDELPEE